MALMEGLASPSPILQAAEEILDRGRRGGLRCPVDGEGKPRGSQQRVLAFRGQNAHFVPMITSIFYGCVSAPATSPGTQAPSPRVATLAMGLFWGLPSLFLGPSREKGETIVVITVLFEPSMVHPNHTCRCCGLGLPQDSSEQGGLWEHPAEAVLLQDLESPYPLKRGEDCSERS